MTILSLDLGTSSVRGLVLDADAVPLPGALARRPVRLALGADGTATIDGPEFLSALLECLDELAAAGWLEDVELVTTAAQWHSVVPLNPAGEPLGPVLTWLDTRPEPLPGAPVPSDPTAFHHRTGTWWHRFYWNVRLPWLRERVDCPGVRFGGLAEYILGMLLDCAPMSVSQASATGLLDLRSMGWDGEACELAQVRAGELPELAPHGWRGRLRPEHARRWPALRDAPWAPPVGDGAASNVGCRAVDPDWAAVTVGTSAAVRLVQPAPAGEPLPPLPPSLWRYRVDHGHIVTGAAFSGGGNLFAWADRVLRLPTGEDLDEALEAVSPGGGVRADPRFGGDRPPGLAPAGSGQLAGLDFSSGAVDIVAGLMSALCRQVAVSLDDIESTVQKRVRVVLGGGAMTASAWWRRSFAQTLSPREVWRASTSEIGATGAALVAIGRLDAATGIEPVSRTDEPEGGAATGDGS
ncbi:FGGY family carbohydrate kinase [Plantactinospora sp. KBS50]|uniref:FGGY family carbohydrate kinase n=1 Tax=Plantactinospora sp. KBS50 TaxID=2024580 RepID=UPI000BAADD32|nr:FGGY family carbohydrate kinase [Plantactinospora sp. KBS50]ASW55815.1 carbohydrate kinase [Plantactinospora sp. KBS50]